LETLGLDDLITHNSILLIEWGEKFARFERERNVEIALERVDERVEQRFFESASATGPESRPELIEENVRRITITAP
jgi:tRNA A37 threonylcarbamoyladenosine biosynthesis protein TsaE